MKIPSRCILGTRGSALALVQAEATESALRRSFPHMEIVRKVIKTTGDKRTDVALSEVAKADGTFDKGVFIKEIEEALEAGEIDIAVHSLKDLPTNLGAGFQLAAVLPRAAVRDVLISHEECGLNRLKIGARVGTSSVRRAHQLQWLRKDLKISDLRGNVPTRIEKCAESGDYDAIVLAEAGLVRLGFLNKKSSAKNQPERLKKFPSLFATRMAESEFFPAAGQGAIGLEVRAQDAANLALAAALSHANSWLRTRAEREFLRLLDGGCNTPVGIFSKYLRGKLTLHARVFPENGGHPLCGQATGQDPLSVAHQLFHNLS